MSKVVFTPSPYNNNLQCTLNRGERMTAFETARAFKKHWLRWLNIAPKHLESNENNEMQQCLHFATLKQQYNHSQELDTFNSFPMTNNDLAHQDTLDRDTDDQQQNRPGLTTSSLPNHLTERTPKVNFVKSNFSISKVNFSSSTEPLYSEKKLANDTDPVPVAEKVLYLAHSGIISRLSHRSTRHQQSAEKASFGASGPSISPKGLFEPSHLPPTISLAPPIHWKMSKRSVSPTSEVSPNQKKTMSKPVVPVTVLTGFL